MSNLFNDDRFWSELSESIRLSKRHLLALYSTGNYNEAQLIEEAYKSALKEKHIFPSDIRVAYWSLVAAGAIRREV